MREFQSDMSSLSGKRDLDRRQMLATSLAVGFAAAVLPVCAQTAITTGTNGLEAGEVKIPVAYGEIPAYRAMPAKGGPFSLVLVVQEIFGVHEHIKDICRRLAKEGYMAVATELYARQGGVAGISDIQEIIKTVVSKVPDAQVALQVTGYERGTITPFGSSTAWPVVADERMAGRQITLGAGQHGVAIAAAADEILAALGATVADVTDPEPGNTSD